MSTRVCPRCGNIYPVWSACACIVTQPDISPTDPDKARAEGYAQGLADAARVAWEKQTEHYARIAAKTNLFDQGAEWAARYIAEAIEELMEKKSPPPPAKEK